MSDCPTCELRREIDALTARLKAIVAEAADLSKILEAKCLEFSARTAQRKVTP